MYLLSYLYPSDQNYIYINAYVSVSLSDMFVAFQTTTYKVHYNCHNFVFQTTTYNRHHNYHSLFDYGYKKNSQTLLSKCFLFGLWI